MSEVEAESKPKAASSSPAARWTPALAKGGFTPVVSSFLDLCGRPKAKGGLALKPTQALTIIQLVSFKRTHRMPFPSVGLLASRMGISQQSVRKSLATLVRRGLIIKRHRPGRSTMFDLTPLFIRLEVLQEAAQARKDAERAAAEALLLPESHPAPTGAEG